MLLYSVALNPIFNDPNYHDVNNDAEAEAAEAVGNSGGARGGRGAASTNVDVKIDWDGIDRRFNEVTSMANVQYVVPSPDGRTYLFAAGGGAAGGAAPDAAAAGPGMYTIAEDGTRQTKLNTTVTDTAGGRGRGGRGGGGGGGFGGGNEPTWARDGRSIYFMQGGGLFNLPINVANAANDSATAATGTGGRGGGGGGRGGRGGGVAGRGGCWHPPTPATPPDRVAFRYRCAW